MNLLLIIAIVLSISFHSIAANVHDFSTDGCTLAPDGTFSKPTLWHECCVAHDLWYWGGGPKSLRMKTDDNLKSCIASKAGSTVATLFLLGVRVGSVSPFKLKNKKWGNAWGSSQTDYFELTAEQKNELLRQINLYPRYTNITQYYKEYLAKGEANSLLQ